MVSWFPSTSFFPSTRPSLVRFQLSSHPNLSASMPTKGHTEEDYARMGDPVLLDKIDKLFECNLGDLVDLPQLVVVGDQSSGKSSVLAGLTKLPFPRDSGLCTRFATQIIFRRSNVENNKVSIIPGPKSNADHVANVKSWHTEVEKLDADSFKRILSEVSGVMWSSCLWLVFADLKF